MSNNESLKNAINFTQKEIIRNAEIVLGQLDDYDIKGIEIKIINNIEREIKKYKKRTGASKTFIAKKMGFKKVQNLDSLIKSTNPTISSLIKLSLVLECGLLELFDYQVFEED